MTVDTYVYLETPAAEADAPLVLTFHGTGGDERQFHDFAADLCPGAGILSPRGDVSENGALRYFRRKAEGVYDMADLELRTQKMAGFIAAHKKCLRPKRVIGLGYSNGANILAAVVFQHAGLFDDVVLMHPLIPWQPADNSELSNLRVLITAGRHDPICPALLTVALNDYFVRQGAKTTLDWHAGGHELRSSEQAAVAKFLGPATETTAASSGTGIRSANR